MTTISKASKKAKEESVDKAITALSNHHPMSPALRNAFKERAFEAYINKNEYIIQQGEISEHIYFLAKGIVTGYRNLEMKKVTTFIAVDGEFVSAIGGMYGLNPSEDNIIAVEDCYLIGLKSSQLLLFFEHYPEMNIIMRKILELYYYTAHERAVVIRMGNAKEKYKYYLKSLVAQSDRVPTELVASFLNLKASTLEKIKRELTAVPEIGNHTIVQNLGSTMKKSGLFKQKRLTLLKLADYLNISAHDLSYLLNYYYQERFSDYINAFRIEFVKEQLKDKTNLERLTVEAIGELAGFSSKSTFFAAFRKNTGLSPLLYAKTLNN